MTSPAQDAALGRGKRGDGTSLGRSHVGSGSVPRLFSFPNPVNEVSARLVAAGVVVMCVLTISLGWRWVTGVIAYGFVARVLTGPKLSPLGQFVTRVLTPRLPFAERPVPGPLNASHKGSVPFFRSLLSLSPCPGYGRRRRSSWACWRRPPSSSQGSASAWAVRLSRF